MGKTRSPCPTLRSSRDQMGDGSSPGSLFPCWHLAPRRNGAASFPTLFSTASGAPGLGAGPSSAFRPLDYCVRRFRSLGLVVAPPAHEPDQDPSATCSPRLDHLAQGQPPLLTARLPHATGLASYLSGRFSSAG